MYLCFLYVTIMNSDRDRVMRISERSMRKTHRIPEERGVERLKSDLKVLESAVRTIIY